MRNWRDTALAATAVAALLTLTACGQDEGDRIGGQSVGAAAPAGAPGDAGYGGKGSGGAYGSGAASSGAPATPAGQLAVRKGTASGDVLTDAEGRTLYRFDKDSADPPESACEGDCATAWPVVTAEGAKAPAGVDSALLGALTRPDGTKQLTVDGWPMYRYAKDTKAGDTNGHGVGGTWYAAAPDGRKAAAGASPGPASGEGGGEEAPAGGGADDGYGGGSGEGTGEGSGGGEEAPAERAGLSVREDPKLGEIVVDGEGRTVYRFTKDSAWPMKTACTGACLEKWPVVEPVAKADTEGITTKGYVTFERPDGKSQQTIDCWPLYTFAGDKKPGDTNGQGVGGTWYAVSPDGKLVGASK
ncbi:SCO0930 family lipoprotein [Streptomyces sp. DH12]|uniref:SCO0930 family lipoprotein n=1 Tax=Streptomyces sp. DH12 TaxID=2857010 RepID=UPI001E58BE7E|nr:SCO0930 family lipoprotein [Streptomyces sp. DH12]